MTGDAPALPLVAPTTRGDLTPVERRGDVWVKRDDLFSVAGQQGGKARSCWYLASQPGVAGLVTASSRKSPQAIIVANVARLLGLPARLHMPAGPDTPEIEACRAAGAVVVGQRPGYNSVIKSRARTDAAERGWLHVPFGMECAEAVEQTAGQVRSLVGLPAPRLVVPVGSGMSLAGVLAGLDAYDLDMPVLGVRVGADPSRRLDVYAPGWRGRVDLVQSDLDYHQVPATTVLHGLRLDPVYEAKALPFLQPDDVLWVVGIRPDTPTPA